MTTAELRKIAEESEGNQFNEYKIKKVGNLNPNAHTVINYNFIPVRPLFITKVINRLTDPALPQITPRDIDVKRYGIHEKEDYNHLKRWKEDIALYAPYKLAVEDIYKDFENQGQYKREKVYRWLNREYRRLHDHYYADELFDEMKKFVTSLVDKDVTLFEVNNLEDIEENVCIVLVEAFIECRIFEKPV